MEITGTALCHHGDITDMQKLQRNSNNHTANAAELTASPVHTECH